MSHSFGERRASRTAFADGATAGGGRLELQSDLWLDQLDAHEQIDERLAGEQLSDSEAALLRGFVDHGYMTFPLGLDAEFCTGFDADVARCWDERPADLAIAPPGPAGPIVFRDYDGPLRDHGYRIRDLHGHSEHARSLYLQPLLFRMVELIYGQPAIAFQSLYFEHGSEQALHRDPMFVLTDPPAHLLASWVALEDVSPESGPLAYVPGSHRWPWFEFVPGSVVCDAGVSPAKRKEFAEWTHDRMHEESLEVQRFTCRRGDAFIWHAGLLHGGAPIDDRATTRRSFVVHYCTAARKTTRRTKVRVRDGDGLRLAVSTTDTVIADDRGRGFDNPLRSALRK
jgi:ectoine hydroxylase-related dioxygenase (phytanoyl-CoA dioxygenase family)